MAGTRLTGRLRASGASHRPSDRGLRRPAPRDGGHGSGSRPDPDRTGAGTGCVRGRQQAGPDGAPDPADRGRHRRRQAGPAPRHGKVSQPPCLPFLGHAGSSHQGGPEPYRHCRHRAEGRQLCPALARLRCRGRSASGRHRSAGSRCHPERPAPGGTVPPAGDRVHAGKRGPQDAGTGARTGQRIGLGLTHSPANSADARGTTDVVTCPFVDNPFPFLPDHPHSRVALADAS